MSAALEDFDLIPVIAIAVVLDYSVEHENQWIELYTLICKVFNSLGEKF